MGALGRAVTLYRLLERVREGEVLAASAAVARAEAKLQKLSDDREEALTMTQHLVGDPVGRAASQQQLASCDVLGVRAGALRTQCAEAQQASLAGLAQSRLRVRQVEIALEQQLKTVKSCADKREQAMVDERYLAQWHRAKGSG